MHGQNLYQPWNAKWTSLVNVSYSFKRKTAKTYETIGIHYVHGMQIKCTTNWVFAVNCDSYIVVACIAKATNATLGRDLKGAFVQVSSHDTMKINCIGVYPTHLVLICIENNMVCFTADLLFEYNTVDFCKSKCCFRVQSKKPWFQGLVPKLVWQWYQVWFLERYLDAKPQL